MKGGHFVLTTSRLVRAIVIVHALALGCAGEEPAAGDARLTGGASGGERDAATQSGGASGSGAAGGSNDASAGGALGETGGAAGFGGAAGTGGGSPTASGGAGGAAGALSACGTVPAKAVPALPAAAGTIVEVSTVGELVSAVTNAADGTTILAADGTYYLPGLLRFRNHKRDITLRSKSGNRDAVIIDGSQSSSGEMIWFEEVTNVTVADLTVQNANIHCFTVKGESDADGVRIHNCRIRNCWER